MYISIFISSLIFALLGCSDIFEDEHDKQQAQEHVVDEKSIQIPAERISEPRQQVEESQPDVSSASTPPTARSLNLNPDFIFINEKTIQMALNEWLNSLPKQSAQGPSAPFAVYSASENVLTVNKNTALSFASFQIDKPLTIRTFGHDVILAGDHFEFVHVDTSHPSKASGSLYVFTESESEPTFRVSGSPGETGRDGDCSIHSERCVPVSDRTTRFETLPPSVEWKETTLRKVIHWNSPDVGKEFTKRLISLAQRFHRNYAAHDLCPTAEHALLHEQTHEYSGEVELIQTLKTPLSFRHIDTENQRNATLYEGTRGGNGQNSGQVIIVRHGASDHVWKTPIPGGVGGAGGRNFKTAPLKSLPRFRVETNVIEEKIGLSKFKIKTHLSGQCAGELGMRPQHVRAEFVHSIQPDTFQWPLGVKLSNDSMTLQTLQEGNDLPIDTMESAAHGRSGTSGMYERRHYSDKNEWRKLMPVNLIFPD